MTDTRPGVAPRWTGWTDDAVTALTELRHNNTATEIATALGCTRNAVLGKAHRLGLRMRTPEQEGTSGGKKDVDTVMKDSA